MSAFSEQIFIGIDVSKASLDLAIRAQSKAHQFANTEAGIDALLVSLEPQKQAIAVVLMEATGGLEHRAAAALGAGHGRVAGNFDARQILERGAGAQDLCLHPRNHRAAEGQGRRRADSAG